MQNFLVLQLQKLNWSIRYKIGAAFALLLILFLVNGLVSLVQLYNIRSIETNQQASLLYLERLQQYEIAFRSEVLVYSDNIFVSKSIYIRDTFGDIINSNLRKNIKPDAVIQNNNQNFENQFNDLYGIAIQRFSELYGFIIQGQFQQASVSWQAATPDFNAITALLTQWRSELETEQRNNANSVNNGIFVSTILIVGASSFSVGLVIFLLILIERVLLQPLRKLQIGLRKIAEGDFDQRIEIYNKDEVGNLSVSFQSALGSLQQVLKGVQISSDLQSVTQKLAIVSQQQAVGSGQQVTSLTSIMISIQELGFTAGQIAESARQIANLVGSTVEQINQVAVAGKFSQEQAAQMVSVAETILSGVERVGSQVDGFSELMQELNHKSETISSIVGLIGSIANEVHILSLNASIEAAGAGQYGDRFRVVAQDVKRLAAKSTQAAQEAYRLVSEVQLSSRTTLESVKQGQLDIADVIQANDGLRQSLGHMEESIGKVGSSVLQLLGLAGQVQERTDNIKQASQQQYAANEQVVNSTELVGVIAEQTLATAQEITSNTHVLENLTSQLNGVLSQVKLAS